jgi:RNA polymerase sigma-70 factor (ECF subfamily)
MPAEIATVLGISANAAHSRLHRARRKLADRLRKDPAAAGHEGSTEGRRS